MAYILRMKRNKHYGPNLTVPELEAAKIVLYGRCQQEAFPAEMSCLQRKGKLTSRSRLLQLNPFLDKDGIMRVGGRLQNAIMLFNNKHPIILPYEHETSKAIAYQMHIDTLHGGSELMIGLLRKRYWIVNIKRMATSVYQHCVNCRRFNGQTKEQMMGNLPKVRVTLERSFLHTDIDYAGPIEVRTSKLRNAKIVKGYIAVFVCFGTKAIHLELVSDMTTPAFMSKVSKMRIVIQKSIAAVQLGSQCEAEGNLLEALANYHCAVTHFENILSNAEFDIGNLQQDIKECLQTCIERIQHISKITGNDDTEASTEQLEVTQQQKQPKATLTDRVKSTVICRTPTINFSDVCGLEKEKKLLLTGVAMPLLFPESFNAKRTAFKAFLLFGPPGTGKSFLAEAVAGEALGSTFFSVRASDLTSKYYGESEQLVRELFTVARNKQPSIIFIDEIDSLMKSRSADDNEASRRIKTELLTQLQGVSSDNTSVFFMAATNTPQHLDSAFLRRFDNVLYVPLPDRNARLKILATALMNGDGSTNFTNDDISKLSKVTEGLSGSDVVTLCKKAQTMPISRLQDSTHFLLKHDEAKRKPLYIPCSECDEGAIEMNWRAVPRGSLLAFGPVTMEDAMSCATQAKPSTDNAELSAIKKFAAAKAASVETSEPPREPYAAESWWEVICNIFCLSNC